METREKINENHTESFFEKIKTKLIKLEIGSPKERDSTKQKIRYERGEITTENLKDIK